MAWDSNNGIRDNPCNSNLDAKEVLMSGLIHSHNQATQVYDYIKLRGSITQKDAWDHLGISDLAGRIRDLKTPRYGCVFEHDDESGINRFGNKVSYRRYKLAPEGQQELAI